MTRTHIGDRLGYYDENGQYVTHRQLTRKPPVSFRKRVRRAWQVANRPREFIFTPGKGIQAFFLLSLLALGVLFGVDQYFRFNEAQASIFGGDTQQTIWDGGNDLDNWNCRSGTNPVANRIRLDSNTTHAAYCLLKTPFDISIVSGKSLGVAMIWYLVSNPGTYPSELGWYFTRNATAPSQIADYTPVTDDNVGMVVRHTDGGAGTESGVLFIQKDTGIDVSSGDPGGCSTGGTVFLCDDGSLPDSTAEASYSELRLNFTGNVGSASSTSYLFIGETALPPNIAGATTTETLPWLQFQGQQYYLGIYVRARSPDPVAIEWDFVNPEIFLSTPLPSTPEIPSQRIDTGGFFGPIIRALINVGLLVIEQITRFFGWVIDLFVDAMNVVGDFFGLGAIGTAIRDALVGVGTWVSNVFGTIFGQAVNIATAISNTLSAVVQVTGTYWTQLTSWLSAMSNLLSLFWPFIAFFGVGLPFSALMTYWLIQGIIMSYNSNDGAFKWMRWTWILSATIFNIMWAIGERAFDVILNAKRLLAQWL